MRIATTRWSPESEIALIPLATRHIVCPFDTPLLSSKLGRPLCVNCFRPTDFLGLTEENGIGLPCSCVDARDDVSFVRGQWTARCPNCERTWRGESSLGEHGRWQTMRPKIVAKHPPGVHAPRWLFEDELIISAMSSGSVSFRSESGMIGTVSVIVSGREPLEGQLEPFDLSFCPDGQREFIETIVPDAATRERLRSLIDRSIRDRLEEAFREDQGLIQVRRHVNLMTRVFDRLG